LSESLEELMIFGIKIVFLLLGILLLISILMSKIDPYKQIAYSNVQQLKAAMNEACFIPGKPVEVSFQLPQNTPMLSSLLTFAPKWITRTSGDPNYVIYYEMFPPGEAIGWEAYHEFQNKVIIYTNDPNNVKNKKLQILNEYAANNRPLDGIMLGNVLLDGRYDIALYDKNSENKNDQSIAGNIEQNSGSIGSTDNKKKSKWPGSWKEGNIDKYDVFSFSNYLGMSNFQRTAIKYQACGVNSLCLKTRDGVYRFPLEQCKDIKYVGLSYDDRNRIAGYTIPAAVALAAVGAGGAAGGAASSGTVLVGGGEAGAAAVASGAKLTAISPGVYAVESAGTIKGISVSSGIARTAENLFKIAPTGVKIETGAAAGYGIAKLGAAYLGNFIDYKSSDFYLASPCSINQVTIEKTKCDCKQYTSFPIYARDGAEVPKYRQIGTHYACIEGVSDASAGENYPDSCLIIKVKEPNGFCWTLNAYENSVWNQVSNQFASWLGVIPVKDHTTYSNINGDNIFKLTGSTEGERYIARPVKQLFDTDWVWPGSLSSITKTICKQGDKSCEPFNAGVV
jgi:hypothetical protein